MPPAFATEQRSEVHKNAAAKRLNPKRDSASADVPRWTSTGMCLSYLGGGGVGAQRWKHESANHKSSSVGSVENFQTLLAGLQRYPAISEAASRLLLFFSLSLPSLFTS